MATAVVVLAVAVVIALAALAMLMTGIARARWPFIAGPLLSLAALVALIPVTCESTAIGFDVGPDPNGATCNTPLIHGLDSVKPYHPDTHQDFTAVDVLRLRMGLRALAAAGAPLVAAVAGNVLLVRRGSADRANTGTPSSR